MSRKFRSALPHGERPPVRNLWHVRATSFDPRSRTGSDIFVPNCGAHAIRFRSALPHGERRRIRSMLCASERFDPRSRTGSDEAARSCGAFMPVSIRAPARGATRRNASSSPAAGFRSALPHGERHSGSKNNVQGMGFDPRSRTGSDIGMARKGNRTTRFDPRSRTGSDVCTRLSVSESRSVSIRAPARGATHRDSRNSNPETKFRSALPHGERLAAPSVIASMSTGFDPRSRTGSDSRRRGPAGRSCRFRSALPHGERRRMPAQARGLK